MVDIFNLEVWQVYTITILCLPTLWVWIQGGKGVSHWFPRYLNEYQGAMYAGIFLLGSIGCGTAPSRFATNTTTEQTENTSVDIATANAQAEFDRAFAAKYKKQPENAVVEEVVLTEGKAQGRTLPKKSTPIAKVVKLQKKVAQPRVEQEEVAQVIAPPPQRRVAPPESTVPCYLHTPPAVPSGDLVEFRNETQRHVGFRINGEFVTVVGAIPQPNTRALPYGVPLTPSLLPPGMRCYFAMRTAGGVHHIDSVLFRVDPYSGQPQGMGKASDYVTIASPRSRAYTYAFKNYMY